MTAARVRGGGLLAGVTYDASACMGKDLFRIVRSESAGQTPPDLVSIKISRDLARRLGAAKKEGESLNDVAARLLQVGLQKPV